MGLGDRVRVGLDLELGLHLGLRLGLDLGLGLSDGIGFRSSCEYHTGTKLR